MPGLAPGGDRGVASLWTGCESVLDRVLPLEIDLFAMPDEPARWDEMPNRGPKIGIALLEHEAVVASAKR